MPPKKLNNPLHLLFDHTNSHMGVHRLASISLSKFSTSGQKSPLLVVWKQVATIFPDYVGVIVLAQGFQSEYAGKSWKPIYVYLVARPLLEVASQPGWRR